MKRLASIGVCIGAIAGLHAAPRSDLRVVEPWRCFFGGQPVTLHLEAVPDQLSQYRVSWHLSVERAVVATGERTVRAGPDPAAIVPLEIECPTPRQGTVASGRLIASLVRLSDRKRLAGIEIALRFYPKDPFADRRKWAASLDLRLFDPPGDTARQFQALGIPFTRIGDPRTLKWGNAPVLLMTGAGLSFRDYPGLLEWLIHKATDGANVLCIAPSEGSFPVSDQATSRPEQFLLEGNSRIARLDPKLDAAAWPPNGAMTVSSLTCSNHGPGSPRLVIAPGNRGWPWLSLTFPSGGRFVLCGLDLIGKWNNGPVPRYLLVRILDWMTAGSREKTKETHHVVVRPKDR